MNLWLFFSNIGTKEITCRYKSIFKVIPDKSYKSRVVAQFDDIIRKLTNLYPQIQLQYNNFYMDKFISG